MNKLVFDLEIGPLNAWAWEVYQTNLLSVIKDWPLLSVSWKVNDGKTIVVSKRTMSEKKMVKLLWKLFDEADVLIAQNGDRFDIKLSNMLFLRHGLPPPSPYKTVDTLKLAKKYFRFPMNNLDYLCKTILGKSKIETDKSLWFKCLAGDEKAFKQMEEYNKRDVDLTYELYEAIKCWHTGHPNVNLFQGTTHSCPVCGDKTQRRGFMVTRVGKYQRYQCTSCGAWSKGEKIKHDKVIS